VAYSPAISDTRSAIPAALVAGVAHRGPPDERPRVGVETMLTASTPEGDLPLPPSARAPSALRLPVAHVENPSLQGVAIQVTLRWSIPGGSDERTIGTVALFPSDQPGTFNLPLPAEVKDLLAHPGSGKIHVRLRSSVAGGTLVEPLKVVFGDPMWR
jgi:hypothetical protein